MSPYAGDDGGGEEASPSMFESGEFFSDEDASSPPVVKRVVLDEVSAHVNRVNVDGLARTKDDIVTKVCQDVFKAGNFAGKLSFVVFVVERKMIFPRCLPS